eukprot:TRINITY_DN34609_c0_g1_i1.p1 TRINITY_DN34609_c0_g1~~TRINITY_DN34609_c0_g1_i1.p1  ORF type:complete len:491 (+),score=63.59 TRINITY_DN34609_c0_g1_i1:67-1539(+)
MRSAFYILPLSIPCFGIVQATVQSNGNGDDLAFARLVDSFSGENDAMALDRDLKISSQQVLLESQRNGSRGFAGLILGGGYPKRADDESRSTGFEQHAIGVGLESRHQSTDFSDDSSTHVTEVLDGYELNGAEAGVRKATSSGFGCTQRFRNNESSPTDDISAASLLIGASAERSVMASASEAAATAIDVAEAVQAAAMAERAARYAEDAVSDLSVAHSEKTPDGTRLLSTETSRHQSALIPSVVKHSSLIDPSEKPCAASSERWNLPERYWEPAVLPARVARTASAGLEGGQAFVDGPIVPAGTNPLMNTPARIVKPVEGPASSGMLISASSKAVVPAHGLMSPSGPRLPNDIPDELVTRSVPFPELPHSVPSLASVPPVPRVPMPPQTQPQVDVQPKSPTAVQHLTLKGAPSLQQSGTTVNAVTSPAVGVGVPSAQARGTEKKPKEAFSKPPFHTIVEMLLAVTGVVTVGYFAPDISKFVISRYFKSR